MKTVTSVSGGMTSAYVAAKYTSDYNVFALVRTSDKKCIYPDVKLRQMVSDRIGKEFIGTLEDDLIIITIFELEQFIGREITWVSGITYDEVLKLKGGWLPNVMHRYCTTHLKLQPIFDWWAEKIGEPVKMQIGFRANEQNRAAIMNEKLNQNGLLEFKATFEKNKRGQNKWEQVEWEQPVFPLIETPTYKDQIVEYWKDKPVTFAPLNNCVGCFHRNPLLLRKMFDQHPNKMNWFAEQERIKNEGGSRGQWRKEMTYKDISKHHLQHEINFDDFSGCDTGHCGL